MFTGFCGTGAWGTLGTFGGWSLFGLILSLGFWFVLLTGVALLVLRALRSARAPAAQIPVGAGQPTAKEILQAQYARGEITREQYESKKQDLG